MIIRYNSISAEHIANALSKSHLLQVSRSLANLQRHIGSQRPWPKPWPYKPHKTPETRHSAPRWKRSSERIQFFFGPREYVHRHISNFQQESSLWAAHHWWLILVLKGLFDIEKLGLSNKKGDFSILFVVILVCYLGPTPTTATDSWTSALRNVSAKCFT